MAIVLPNRPPSRYPLSIIETEYHLNSMPHDLELGGATQFQDIPKSSPTKIEFVKELDNDRSLLFDLRKEFEKHLERAGWNNAEIRNLMVLAVDEAVANAMVHGNLQARLDPHESFADYAREVEQKAEELKGQKNLGKKVHVQFKITSHEVQVVVSDDGEGFSQKKIDELNELVLSTKRHGRGLQLITRVADEVRFGKDHQERNCITMLFSKKFLEEKFSSL